MVPAENFINDINKINNNIKFSVEHTRPYKVDYEFCEVFEKSLETSIPFLDTKKKIEGGKFLLTPIKSQPTGICIY